MLKVVFILLSSTFAADYDFELKINGRSSNKHVSMINDILSHKNMQKHDMNAIKAILYSLNKTDGTYQLPIVVNKSFYQELLEGRWAYVEQLLIGKIIEGTSREKHKFLFTRIYDQPNNGTFTPTPYYLLVFGDICLK